MHVHCTCTPVNIVDPKSLFCAHERRVFNLPTIFNFPFHIFPIFFR